MTGLELIFIALAVLTGAAGLLAVTSPRVVHCALWLVVCLGCLAGVYLVLGAEVVALVQLLVYVGAVVVLVLFALMLTRAPITASSRLDAPPAQRWAAALVAVALTVLLTGVLVYVVGDAAIEVDLNRGNAAAVGTAIFAGWVLPFELLSVLLLAALVGALAISKQHLAPDPEVDTASADGGAGVIHLIGPLVLACALAGVGVYGLLARRNAVLVLIGAELLLNAANLLLVTVSALPAGGLSALPGVGVANPVEGADPLLSGQSMAIFVITIAAAEIGLALAIVLLLFRTRGTVELTQTRELGEASRDLGGAS